MAGSRAAEDALVDWLGSHGLTADDLKNGRTETLRLVVPTSGLRTHLSARLVARVGRPLLGLRIQTLYGLAREILEASGESVRPAGALESTLVSRATRQAEGLGPILGELEDGLRAPLRSVRDLLDAGPSGHLNEQSVAAAMQSLTSDGVASPRTCDVLQIAQRTSAAAAAANLDLRGGILGRAAERVAEGGLPWPPQRFIVFGFSDITGVGVALLRAVLMQAGGVFIADVPPGVAPGREATFEEGNALSVAFRVTGLSQAEEVTSSNVPPKWSGFGARGPRGEAQECARRIRTLIDAGATAERIGLVVPSFESYAEPLRRHLSVLGVPFSGGSGEASPTPVARWRCLPALLRDPTSFPADEFLGLLRNVDGEPLVGASRVRLRLALRTLGVSTLEQLCDADWSSHAGVFLPYVRGLDVSEGRKAASARRESVSGVEIDVVAEVARGVVAAVTEIDDGTLEEGLRNVAHCVSLVDPSATLEVGQALAVIPPLGDFRVLRAELLDLLTDALASLGRGRLGGRGGGVALLTLRESRSRTFDHVFVLGANRAVFPRSGGDDPLLPERDRSRLRSQFPLLPRVGGVPALERHTVAQLLSSSPNVTLSWQTVSSDGKPMSASPLVNHLLELRGPDASAPEALAGLPSVLPRPSPVDDYVLRAGLYGSRQEVRILTALASTRLDVPGSDVPGSDVPPSDSELLAAARNAILEEVDPNLDTEEGRARWTSLGPFLGQVSPVTRVLDPRERSFSANSLEGLASCGWRTFLTSYLGVREMPDPRASVPEVNQRLVGNLVHQVLEVLAVRQGLEAGGKLSAALARADGIRIPRPTSEDLESESLNEARALLVKEGLVLPGLAELLQRRAAPFIEQAFSEGAVPPPPLDGPGNLEGPGEAAHVIGVEIFGEAKVAGYSVMFRADRVDRMGSEVNFVDYKSGKAISDAVRPETRSGAYRQAVAQGRKLQAGIYSRATGPENARGSYLFLKPELKPAARRVEHGSSDVELQNVLEEVVTTLASALRAGQVFPRVVDPKGEKEPSACSYCAVAAACVRGDSSARGRLVRYASRPAEEQTPEFVGLWNLPRAGKEEK